MSRIIACIILVLAVASVLVPVGVGYTQPRLRLEVAAGELSIYDDWSISPCKYEYEGRGQIRACTTIYNRSSKDASFDYGDGDAAIIVAKGNSTHYYNINYLGGQTVRFRITKLIENGTGIRVEEALILKIVPKEGGD